MFLEIFHQKNAIGGGGVPCHPFVIRVIPTQAFRVIPTKVGIYQEMLNQVQHDTFPTA